jgi:branched-chain amino acid transport system substrate-binding protein
MLVAGGCAKSEPTTGGSEAEPIKVGAVLSLTGTYAALGTSEQNALKLEVDRINAAGGVGGRKIDLIIEDDATDEAKAVAATTKLIEQDQVAALIGATGTGQTMAMRGDVDRSGIPQISMAGGTVVTGSFDKLVYQTPWSNTIVVPFVLDAIKKTGATKIAVVSDTGGYGKDGLAVIESAAKTAGLEIVTSQTFNPGDTDLSAQLTKVKSSDAEAVLLWTAGKEGALAVKTGRDLGLKQPFFGGSGQARQEFVTGAGDAAEGFVFGTGKSLVPSTWGAGSAQEKAVADFAERYKEAYGDAPDIFAGHAFDAVAILADALNRTKGDTDPATLNAAIEKTSGLLGFGGAFTFGPDNHNGLTANDLQLYSVKAGTITPVGAQ